MKERGAPMRPDDAFQLLARRILSVESAGGKEIGRVGEATLRKLVDPFARMIGFTGFHAIVARSLHVTKLELGAFKSVELDEAGSLRLDDLGSTVDERELAHFMESLLARTFRLLVTFIGDELTLRFVRDVWPELRENS